MSREQYDWLERKGVENLHNLDYLDQNEERVRLIDRSLGLIITRKKFYVGEVF